MKKNSLSVPDTHRYTTCTASASEHLLCQSLYFPPDQSSTGERRGEQSRSTALTIYMVPTHLVAEVNNTMSSSDLYSTIKRPDREKF